jgi:hypothetical protein
MGGLHFVIGLSDAVTRHYWPPIIGKFWGKAKMRRWLTDKSYLQSAEWLAVQ